MSLVCAIGVGYVAYKFNVINPFIAAAVAGVIGYAFGYVGAKHGVIAILIGVGIFMITYIKPVASDSTYVGNNCTESVSEYQNF